MIGREEILAVADEAALGPRVVEKDYMLGWLLAGISRHPNLGTEWVFKGGTCLKKCYFETYRFSEDLDFTLRSESRQFMRSTAVKLARFKSWIKDIS